MVRALATLVAGLGLWFWALPSTGAGAQEAPLVRAVFFYMPTCEHCHKVIEEDLPPIMERFGGQLLIAFVDVSHGAGLDLFYAVADQFGIPEAAQGVPMMVVGSEVLNGDVEIPARLAQVVEQGVGAGGVGWPDVPGMEAIAAQESATPVRATAEGAAVVEPEREREPVPEAADMTAAVPDMTPPTMREQWAADPVAFGITLAVLVAMVASLGWVLLGWWRGGLRLEGPSGWRAWAIPVLCALGIVVAAYLAYVETTSSKAVCGPVGDCNAVQQSSYARLFGILPVGVLGLVGYLFIVGLWAWQRRGPEDVTRRTRWLLPAVLVFGLGFSIYLTLLELFVIHAICMWCVTSAVTMTLLLWAAFLGWSEPSSEGAARRRDPARVPL